MRRSPAFLLWLWVLIALVTGCVSPGRRLEPKVVSQVERGTPRSVVEGLLGKPRTEGTDALGHPLVTYRYSVGHESLREDLWIVGEGYPDRRLAGHLLWRMLTVLYDSSNCVARTRFSNTSTPYFLQVNVPADVSRKKWVGTEIKQEFLNEIVKGKTTLSEIELILGDPTWTSFSVDGDDLFGWYHESQAGRMVPWVTSQQLVVKASPDKVVIDYALFRYPSDSRSKPAPSSRDR